MNNQTQQSFEYKGYTLIQELGVNYHYMIFDSNEKFCMHASCTRKLESQQEAEKEIDQYLRLKEKALKDKIKPK